MNPAAPCLARSAFGRLALTLLSAMWPVAVLDAQPQSAAVYTRDLPRVESRVQPGRAVWQENENIGRSGPGVNLKLVASAAYDSNVFLSSDHPESDFVVAVSPQVSIGTGGEPGGDAGFVRVAYLPAFIIYQDNSDSNRVDHDVRLAAGWRGKMIDIAYDGSFRRLGDATADTGVPADRNEYDSAVRMAWLLREKLTIAAAAGTSGTNYDHNVFFNTRQRYGEISLNYEYSPKTQLALIYRIGREEVDGGGRQNFQRLLARLAWQPREKIRIDLGAGIERRKYDLGSETNPVLDGRITWQPREGTEFYLAGFLREEASGYFVGQNYQLANATLGMSQALGGGWTAKMEGGFERASYLRVSGSGQADRVDRILFLGPTIEYAPNDALKLGIFYRYSHNSSNQNDFGYTDHQVGVNMEYQF